MLKLYGIDTDYVRHNYPVVYKVWLHDEQKEEPPSETPGYDSFKRMGEQLKMKFATKKT